MKLIQGDCLEILKKAPENSIDSLVTDPPAGINFMNKSWDKDKGGRTQWVEWFESVMRECYRVMKPGAHGVVWALPRTSHWTAWAIENAGFEIRDSIHHVFGSGFPKSANVSKQLDKQEQNRWLNLAKAVDNLDHSCIKSAWNLSVEPAHEKSEKSPTVAGTSTPKRSSVLVSVVHPLNLKKELFDAIIAELMLNDLHHTFHETKSIVHGSAEAITTPLKKHVKCAERSFEGTRAPQYISTFIAQCDAKESLSENKALTTKAVEALTIWLGKSPSLRKADIDVLCVELTDVLRLTILNRSETFRSLDMTFQTAFASVINVTITESMAESLISFTADTLKSKAIDKAAGAEREVIQERKINGDLRGGSFNQEQAGRKTQCNITAPSTTDAKKWNGFGTALKPAHEVWWLIRKPLSENTIAKNVLKWGCGAINIDGCRIDTVGEKELNWTPQRQKATNKTTAIYGGGKGLDPKETQRQMFNPQGRFPSNFICSGDARDALDEQSGLSSARGGKPKQKSVSKCAVPIAAQGGPQVVRNDFGGASRFFYCAKASKRERNEGCEGMEDVMNKSTSTHGNGSGKTRMGNVAERAKGITHVEMKKTKNHHPTVKAQRLMIYLCRLVTPPGGIILDPFMGSGSTGVAAVAEKFDFIGIEQNQEYLDISRARIEFDKTKTPR